MFEIDDGRLAPPSSEILGAGLILFCMFGVGVDLFRWVVHTRTPSLAVLYIPTFFVSALRRLQIMDGDCRRTPAALWVPLSAYYVAIITFALSRGIHTTSDRW